MDTLSKSERSKRMSLVRSRDTKPERLVRSVLLALGYHFTTHDRSLPGNPDFVFRKRRKVIFVHGCFWHRHACLNGVRVPKSRRGFWLAKLERNIQRDRINRRLVNKQGWRYMTIWECKMKHPCDLTGRITRFLEGK